MTQYLHPIVIDGVLLFLSTVLVMMAEERPKIPHEEPEESSLVAAKNSPSERKREGHNDPETPSVRRPVRVKPPSFQLLQWQRQRKKQVIRSEQYSQLRTYEAQRRITFANKLEATQLYFKSLMELLENSVTETAKVHRLVEGTTLAQSQYARALTVPSPFQVPRGASPSAELLHSWQNSNTLLAATLEENSSDIERNVTSLLTSVRDALGDQKLQFESTAKPILEELEFMEKQVQQTWDAFWKTASKILDGGTSQSEYHSSPSPLESAVALDEEEHSPNEDLWLVEMQYQMCVKLQQSTWDKRGPEIARFAAACKEMEAMRRMRLNECMVKFLHRMQTFFHGIAEEDIMLGTTNTGKDAPQNMGMHNFVPLPMEIKMYPEMPLGGKMDVTLAAVEHDGETDIMGLQRDRLVQACKVLEWKNNTAAFSADRWRTALVVITVDSYLHIFDLSPYCAQSLDQDEDLCIQPGCDPNVALQSLFPHILEEMNNLEGVDVRRIVSGGKMVPEKTIYLNRKDWSYQRLSEECCEISENELSSGNALLGTKKKPPLLSRLQFRILSIEPNSSDKSTFFFTLWRVIDQS